MNKNTVRIAAAIAVIAGIAAFFRYFNVIIDAMIPFAEFAGKLYSFKFW